MPKSILIVDDNVAVRNGIRRLLGGQEGIEVCGEAVDGEDAIEKAIRLRPDLIVLDLEMPRMNGLQAARQMRVKKMRVPIILFTNYADAIGTEAALSAGVSAVVSKTNTEELQQQIENLLDSGAD